MSTSPKIMPTSDYMISAKKGALFAKIIFVAFLDQIHLQKWPKGGRGRTELYNYDYLIFIAIATLYSSKPFGYPRVNLAKWEEEKYAKKSLFTFCVYVHETLGVNPANL